ncbi:RING finger protein 37 isoform X1 [Polypterus senegalus]|uniref:RING finger protein 37 isoform X1 n=2 Tax=Polypterus senegalus TaxID=55291 RepID=UPI00196509B4|nr:RING finger protein 37 isoform X1 [Polypterus senegalus]XP_039614987.1 RING finger protein 37 isoform X1 [Polypterus senegalus]
MVIDLCLPHFKPSIDCNKVDDSRLTSRISWYMAHSLFLQLNEVFQYYEVCADGYEVSNLISEDISLKRCGFRAEYFIRPPVHVTLHFPFKAEIKRVDLDLRTEGANINNVSQSLEMYTSSCSTKPKSTAEEYLTCKESPECSEKEVFTLVGKCLLKGKSQVSFWNRGFRSRIPFEKMEPPVLEASVVEQDLWSKGPASLAGVMSLRICLSFVVGNCPLGIKKLSVWGQPSRSCSSDIIEKLLKAHSGNKKAVSDLTIVSENPEPQQPVLLNEDLGIPEEFLDPITQELMTLPILLPSGKAVDQSTLEEYNKREAAWGRSPNDPFTAVPFSKDSRPLPHPCLKSRIDLFLLQKGDQCLTVPFVVGRTSCSQLPQPSRLTSEKTSLVSGKRKGEYVSVSPLSDDAVQNKIASHLKPAFECTSFGNAESTSSEKSLAAIQEVKNSSLVQKCSKELNGQRQEECAFSSATMIPAKKLRAEEHNTLSSPADSGSSTHMQRLSDSLDTALASALRTFPSFTAHLKKSNVDQTRFESTGRCSLNLSDRGTILHQTCCCLCSQDLSLYSKSTSCFCLPCSHLLCRTCLSNSCSNKSVQCPSCNHIYPRGEVTRVHF